MIDHRDVAASALEKGRDFGLELLFCRSNPAVSESGVRSMEDSMGMSVRATAREARRENVTVRA